jgi:hypothetical protein
MWHFEKKAKLGKLIKIFIVLLLTSCFDLGKPSSGNKIDENLKNTDCFNFLQTKL